MLYKKIKFSILATNNRSEKINPVSIEQGVQVGKKKSEINSINVDKLHETKMKNHEFKQCNNRYLVSHFNNSGMHETENNSAPACQIIF